MHPFQSPYRCEACNARFWVISRSARWGAAAGGAFIVTLLAIALVPLYMHHQTGVPSDPPAPIDGAVYEQSMPRLELNTPSLHEAAAPQDPALHNPIRSSGF